MAGILLTPLLHQYFVTQKGPNHEPSRNSKDFADVIVEVGEKGERLFLRTQKHDVLHPHSLLQLSQSKRRIDPSLLPSTAFPPSPTH